MTRVMEIEKSTTVVEIATGPTTVIEVLTRGQQGPPGAAGGPASDITFVPAGTIEATNVQDAVEEAVTEYLAAVAAEASARAAADTALADGLAQTAPVVAGVAAAQPLMKKLIRNIDSDADLLVISDSTANELTEWPYRILTTLAAAFPAWTVKYRLWNSGTVSYDAATTLQTGSGARTLTLWNASVSGWATDDALPILPSLISGIQPDLAFVALCHNEMPAPSGMMPTASGLDFRERMLCLTETLRQFCPLTPITLIAQNPEVANTNQANRAKSLSYIAANRGYGFIDVHQAFLDYGAWAADLTNVDGIHPNTAGEVLWAAEVSKHLVYRPSVAPLPASLSSLLEGGEQLLPNGDFGQFNGTYPDGWTGNGTASQDTTHFETGTYSLRLQCAAAVQTVIAYDIPNLEKFRGYPVTFLVRVMRNAGLVTGCGRIGVQQNVAGATFQSFTNRRGPQITGVWQWEALTMLIDPAADTVRLRLYADSGTGGIGDVSFDRAVLVRGVLPRDFIREASVTASFAPAVLTDGATVTPDEKGAKHFTWIAKASPRTIAPPANREPGKDIVLEISNDSGGPLALTFAGPYKLAGSFTPPTDQFRRTISFRDMGGELLETGRVGDDMDPDLLVTTGLAFRVHTGSLSGPDGAPISRWADVSGNRRDLVQSVVSKQPTLVLNQLNGYAAARFNGIGQTMRALLGTGSGADQPVSMMAVLRAVSLPASGSKDIMALVGPTPSRHLFGYTGPSSYRVVREDDAATVATATTASGVATASAQLVTMVFNGTTVDFWVNGVQKLTASALDVGTDTLTILDLGGTAASGLFANVDVFEALLWDHALNGTERSRAEAFETAKFAL